MIYRIAEQSEWVQTQRNGYFASADLAAEGFIHSSELHQVLRTANKYYRGRSSLVLLEIDDALLGDVVVREDLTGAGMRFPHAYAPIPIHAIVRHFDFAEDEGGGFSLPEALDT